MINNPKELYAIEEDQTEEVLNIKGIDLINTSLKSLDESIAKITNPMYQQIKEAFKEAREVVRRINAKAKEAILNLYDYYREMKKEISEVSKNIGKEGWFFSFDLELSIYEMRGLKALTSDELNAFFLDYYTQNNERRVIELFESINDKCQRGIIPNRFKMMLSQCMEIYMCKKYCIMTVALCPIIEGLIMSYYGEGRQAKTSVNNGIKKIGSNTEKHGLFMKVISKSIYEFLKKFYRFADFREEEPTVPFNRNWLLHGASDYELEKIDAIKFFSLINSIATLHEWEVCLG